MFWEEKIDHFKKLYSSKDFNVPFTVWSDILKKVEESFNIAYDKKYPLTNWKERLSGLIEKPNSEVENLLQVNDNYWVIVTDLRPTGHNLVYDCKATLVKPFTTMYGYDYYIVDKKYNWLLYYNSDTKKYYQKNNF